jgi:WD40 repeat protein
MKRLLTTSLACLALCLASGFVFESPVSAQQRRPPQKKKEPSPVKKLAAFGGFSDWVMALAYSPDGKKIAAGSFESIRIFDVEKRKELRSIRVRSGGYVRSLAFSPDGNLLIGGHYQGLTIWDAASGERLKRIKGPRSYVTAIDVSPDGNTIATGCLDTKVRLYALPEGEPGLEFATGDYPVNAVKYSPDGKTLAVATGDENRVTKPGFVMLYDAASGEELKKFPEHTKSATDVAFTPDGKRLLSTSVDETVNVYEVESGKALGFFGKHSRPTTAVLFLKNGTTAVTSSGGRAVGKNEVKFWNHADGEEFGTFEPHKQKVTDIALSPDGKSLATASMDNTVVLWSLAPVLAKISGKPVVAANEKVKVTTSDGKTVETTILKAGIIGLDTSHAIAFTKLLNAEKPDPDLVGVRIVAAYPKGSPDIESSTSRVPGYTEEIKKLGVEIVDSIPALLEKVDVVFLETNDGRPHLEQVIPVLKAGKPVFVDKPVAGSLADAIAIYAAAKEHKVPLFSSSSLRYSDGAQAIKNGKLGKILGCDAYSPCSLEKTHPDLFWYGIHGVETLFTVMGPGCERVTRASTPGTDVVTGVWKDGRIGTFRGLRSGKRGYGGTAFGEKGNAPIGGYSGYKPLLVEVVKFFKTGEAPVSSAETLEIYAFMEAADESKRQDGKPVTLESVMKEAQAEAAKRLEAVEGK